MHTIDQIAAAAAEWQDDDDERYAHECACLAQLEFEMARPPSLEQEVA